MRFGFYTAMSSVLSMAIPGGLAAVGGWTLYKMTKPNIQKSTAAVLHIATMRVYAADLLGRKIQMLEKRKMHLMQRLGPDQKLRQEKKTDKKPWWKRLFGG